MMKYEVKHASNFLNFLKNLSLNQMSLSEGFTEFYLDPTIVKVVVKLY